MGDGPLQLFNRDQYLSQRGIDLGFARVKAGDCGYGILILEDISDMELGIVGGR